MGEKVIMERKDLTRVLNFKVIDSLRTSDSAWASALKLGYLPHAN